ncbi:MAG TPA: hypothetical protein EYN06_01615 [Myxococcales bacterium]|nr:hypothetical protein [Myxococcales bacterium]
MLEEIGLSDVVLSFQMKKDVTLVITGASKLDIPGEFTISIHERDFPRVNIELSSEKFTQPYEICTLDYLFSGRTVRITEGEGAGQNGTLVVAATIGGTQQNRIRLTDGSIVTVDGDRLEWV